MSFFNWRKHFWQNEKFQEATDFAIEVIKVVLISLAIIIPVRYFLIQPFYVKGASMEPNFLNHEYLIIDEASFRFRAPERGEIIVFRPPNAGVGDFFIKRIIGLPGERVEVKNGKVRIYNQINAAGEVLDESQYLARDLVTHGDQTWQLKDNEYFVAGDNRPASLDSRMFGPIVKEEIVGRVWLRGWPFDRLKVFATPEYNIASQ